MVVRFCRMQLKNRQTRCRASFRPTRLVRYPYLFSEWHQGKERETSAEFAAWPSNLRNTMETPNPSRAVKSSDISASSNASKKPFEASLQPGQENSLPATPVHGPLGMPLSARKWFEDGEEIKDIPDDTPEISSKITARLMQLSGMMQVVRVPRKTTDKDGNEIVVEEWWPEGIKQTGPLPVSNLYGNEPFGLSLPRVPAVKVAPEEPQAKAQPRWQALLNTPAVKVSFGLLVGIALLLLIAKFVDIPTTMRVLQTNLATPRGITFALLSGMAFLAAFSIRGVRWKLFLNPIGKVSTLKAIQLFLVGIFLNFLLPVRGGEVAKSLMLKRTANIPISQSLPTVAMDKALDLMPALFIMALVPILAVQMDIKLWLVLGMVGGLLICLIFFVLLAAWKRTAAIALLQKTTSILPKSIGNKIEGFATGFVDSLLAGASQPRIFIPAMLLTIL